MRSAEVDPEETSTRTRATTVSRGRWAPRWLLLVVDFMDPAQDQEIQWPAGAVLMQARTFERIWLYKPAFHEVLEIPI